MRVYIQYRGFEEVTTIDMPAQLLSVHQIRDPRIVPTTQSVKECIAV